MTKKGETGTIAKMLTMVRIAVGNCKAPEQEILNALLVEANGWERRLDQLEEEAEDNENKQG